jgi:hypothetical protein
VITALFSKEVQKRIDMDIYKTAKIPPKVIPPATITSAALKALHYIQDNAAAAHVADWDRVVWGDDTSAMVSLPCAVTCFTGATVTIVNPAKFFTENIVSKCCTSVLLYPFVLVYCCGLHIMRSGITVLDLIFLLSASPCIHPYLPLFPRPPTKSLHSCPHPSLPSSSHQVHPTKRLSLT